MFQYINIKIRPVCVNIDLDKGDSSYRLCTTFAVFLQDAVDKDSFYKFSKLYTSFKHKVPILRPVSHNMYKKINRNIGRMIFFLSACTIKPLISLNKQSGISNYHILITDFY